MIIYIDKETKLIKMVSQEKMDFPQFDIEEVKDEETAGYTCKFIDGKIEKEKIINTKEDLKAEVDNAKTIGELKTIITKLL